MGGTPQLHKVGISVHETIPYPTLYIPLSDSMFVALKISFVISGYRYVRCFPQFCELF